jgi:hypothetical protein
MRSSIKSADEQIVLMIELMEEMALMRCRIDKIQEGEYGDPASSHVECEKWGQTYLRDE